MWMIRLRTIDGRYGTRGTETWEPENVKSLTRRDRERKGVAYRGSWGWWVDLFHRMSSNDEDNDEVFTFPESHSVKVTFYGSASLLFFLMLKAKWCYTKAPQIRTSHMTIYILSDFICFFFVLLLFPWYLILVTKIIIVIVQKYDICLFMFITLNYRGCSVHSSYVCMHACYE